MKPIYLEFQAFGPYRGVEKVDFEKLSRSGIFLIKGPTGSGKTTIFDAMTYALYGGSSGDDAKSKTGRNDFESWRCNQADKADPTVVMFEFEANGKRYRFTRKLVPKLKKVHPEFDASVLEDGVWTPLFENPKKESLNKKAEELVGLTKEQFRQVVLLPQGQFEKFLTADSSEKEEILSKIFGTDQWAGYAARFYDEAKARRDKLDEIRKRIAFALEEEGPDCACLEDIEVTIAKLQDYLTKAEADHNAFDGEGRQTKLNSDIALHEKFKQLRKLESDKAALIAKADAVNAAKEALNSAEQAETVRPSIEAHEAAASAAISRQEQLAEAERRVPDKKLAVEAAEEAKAEHDKSSPVEKYQKQIAELESKKSAYEGMKSALDKLREEEQKCKKAARAAEAAKEDFDNATRAAADKLHKSNTLEAAAIDARKKYYSGIYGELASELVDNEKCPVCGSTEHPEPAQKSSDSVSKNDVELAEKNAEKARKAFDAQEEARINAEAAYNEAVGKVNAAESACRIAEKECEMYAAQLIEGIADARALEQRVAELNNSISRYERESEKLATAYDKAKTAYQEQQNAVEHAKQELENAAGNEKTALDEMSAALRENGYDSVEQATELMMPQAERNALRESISEYNTRCASNEASLNQIASELSGCEEPDESSFGRRQEEIRSENAQYHKDRTVCVNNIERLERKLGELRPLEEQYQEGFKQAENDLAFAKKLRGDTGIGLQRYVLGIMFNQVIAEANDMLRNIHGGRYQLIRTDDKGRGNKKGLELIVHDNRSPEQDGRSVGTLSGGEKFLISLALSIGMSSVAQKSGIRIEALFIDEGFGTLDDSSINDAMDVLEYVKRGSSMVGIISHVQLLEANIGTHIEVIKTDEGSTLKA